MITQFLRYIPVRFANVILARIIFKTKLKNKAQIFRGVTLRSNKLVRLDLNPHDIGHQYLAFTGVYEYELTKIILNLASKTSGLMVDVGANYGYYSILWASKNINNKSIAFEASPKNFNAIQNNIQINKLEHKIKLESFAISDQEGVLTFDMGPEDQTGWGGITKEINNENHVSVNSIPLDTYFKDIEEKYIEILKIDTEGADYLVLKGATELLKQKKIKHIFWEENTYRANLLGLEPFKAIDFLERLDYKVKQIGENEYHATL